MYIGLYHLVQYVRDIQMGEGAEGFVILPPIRIQSSTNDSELAEID